MDFSNLEYTYEFKASPTELTTVGEVEDVVEWVEFKLTVKTTYEGQEYEDFADGTFKFTSLRDILESYEGEEKDRYEYFANNVVAVEDVNSSKIMQWLDWDSPKVKSIRDTAIFHLHDKIKSTIEAQQGQQKSTDTITFVD